MHQAADGKVPGGRSAVAKMFGCRLGGRKKTLHFWGSGGGGG